MGTIVIPTFGVILHGALCLLQPSLERSESGVEVKRLIFNAFWRIIVLRPEGNWVPVVAKEGNANLGSGFPTIILAEKVMIQEPLKFVIRVWLVDVVPFLSWMDTKP